MTTDRNIRVICIYYGLAALIGASLAALIGIILHGSLTGLATALALGLFYGVTGAWCNLRAVGYDAAACMLWGIGGKFARGLLSVLTLAAISWTGLLPEQPFLSFALVILVCFLVADVISVYRFSLTPLQEDCC